MKIDISHDVQIFRDDWAKFYGNRLPLSWMLRTDATVPWVRYHALPGSKRYAENDAEEAIILSRANVIGNRLLGRASPCWQIETRTDEMADAGELVGTFKESDDPDEPVWSIYVQAVEWRAGMFDSQFRAIADDEYRALWMSRSDGAVFAPYDGGFDLFPCSVEQVSALKAEHPDWLSSHPEGL